MTERNIHHFNCELLDHIRNGRVDEVKLMLDKNLVKASDSSGNTLLHYAAMWNKGPIIQSLIEMGAGIDCLSSESETPLMIAVVKRKTAAVKILLESNVNVDITNSQGKTALQITFTWMSLYDGGDILKAFVNRFKRDSMTVDEITEKLFDAGCTMFHVAWLRDIDIMKRLLERGISIDSKSCNGMTALHLAVSRSDLNLVMWLLDHNADVNARLKDGQCPLHCVLADGFSKSIQYGLIRTLLEHGANPNLADNRGLTPFSRIFFLVTKLGINDADRCIELFFEHGAILQDSQKCGQPIFNFAAENPQQLTKLLIAHLAMLDKRGMPIAKTIMNDDLLEHPEALLQLQMDFEKCKQVLESKIHAELTLLDLLNVSNHKLRILVRSETLRQNIEAIYAELKDTCPFYSRLLKKRINKAFAILKLEDEAIPVLCELLNCTYNQCHNFSRKIVGYLNEHELQKLSQA